MAEPLIRPIDPAVNVAGVQDLCMRAKDYIVLETGTEPALDYAAKLLAQAPPTVPAEDVFAFGAYAQDRCIGVVTCLRNFYAPREWYMGLLLLDPAVRGAGLGGHMARHVVERARKEDSTCIRVAVLDANTHGRGFWAHQGFRPERTVPADPAGDGHIRHVLKLAWEG